jgi:CheY-like chemotaxis protein
MSFARHTIAIVDDDLLFTGMLRDFLEGEGYRVLTWPEAHGAQTLLRSEQPDLLILDVRMEQPEAGRRILELARQDPETAQIAVIVCSADSHFLRRNHTFLRANATAVLEKPFDLDALQAAIEAALGKPRPRPHTGALDSNATF